MGVLVIIVLVIIGIFAAGIWQTHQGAALSQEGHEGYTIKNVPKSYQEVKKLVNQAFPPLWCKDMPGQDGSIYKQLKMIGRYSGMGPEVGVVINSQEGNENNVDVFIVLNHWETDTYALFLTNYIGVNKAVKRIKKLRRLLGDPGLV